MQQGLDWTRESNNNTIQLLQNRSNCHSGDYAAPKYWLIEEIELRKKSKRYDPFVSPRIIKKESNWKTTTHTFTNFTLESASCRSEDHWAGTFGRQKNFIWAKVLKSTNAAVRSITHNVYLLWFSTGLLIVLKFLINNLRKKHLSKLAG